MFNMMRSFLDSMEHNRSSNKETLAEISKAKVEQKRSHCSVDKENETTEIKRCLQLVVDCGISKVLEEYWVATNLFERKYNRTIFTNFRIDEGRVVWLKRWCKEFSG
jgi:NCAIR mutase (PurE)-related protein